MPAPDLQLSELEVTELGVGQPPGSFHIFNESQQLRPKADLKLLSFLSVGTKQQSRLKYSHSLMSICLRLLVQHSFSRAQSSPSQIDTDTSTILHSFRQSQQHTLNTRFYSSHLIAGKSMPSLGYSRCCCTHASMNALEVIHIVGATGIC